MIRPKSAKIYEQVDLKLGIKSSLPDVKPTLSLLFLMWREMNRPSELEYSVTNGNRIVIREDIGQQLYKKYTECIGNVSENQFYSTINNNLLFKAQLEALLVAFELVWKVAKIRFSDGRANSSERTGGNRYTKKVWYTINMDLLDILCGDNLEYIKVMFSWLGFNVVVDEKCENDIIRLLTAISETAYFKLIDGSDEVIFNLESVYDAVLSGVEPVDISGDKEAKGSLRILKSAFAEGLLFNLEGRNNLVIAKDTATLQEYSKRVETYHRINPKMYCFSDDSGLVHEDESQNEYERAAKYLRSYVSETGFDIPVKKDEIEAVLAEFSEKYSPEILAALSDDELLNYLFYTLGDNLGSLCCWLEMNKECRNHFGSISGGSAYKFGLFQKQKTGEWTTGSPQKSQILTEDEALELGCKIRDALVTAANIVKNATLNTIEDYERLDSELWEKVGEPYCNWGWFHKYLSMVCPDKLSSYHSSDWQRHVLYALKIKPSEKYFARSGQLAMIENYAGWYYSEFKEVLVERFGSDILQFVRIGTSDDEKNYASEWSQKSVFGIGWRDIGSLDDYVAGEGLDKGAIADALKEKFGYPDNIASRKAGELIRFYKTDSSTVAVAMDGQSLLAFIDNIGDYFYDPASAMANMKPGKWHRNFASGEQLPVKAEGKLTSCYQLTDIDNVMFLYDRYYYGSEEIIESVDELSFDNPEERNKRNFRAWMETQVKPEGDSDAGQPYTENSINQYVSNISNTILPSHQEHSVFFTNSIAEVQECITVLENSDKKNNTQKSAIKKYLEFLTEMQEVNMPLQYKTDLPVDYERNRIVFGAPGTGKSFNLKRDCEAFLKDTSGTYERVTFHPDYTYSQFVGTYKPVSDGVGIRYEFVPGPFMRVFVDAMKSARSASPQPHILIIEEINRAKVASVFGDVFQLLDRDDDGVSEYEIQTSEDIRKHLAKELKCDISQCQKIKIPNNMFIWATMNSADQGVFPMDTAFKRRWHFEYLGINEGQDKIKGSLSVGSAAIQAIEWNVLRRAINEKLAKEYKVNEDKLMGPFFISKNVLKTVSETDDTLVDPGRFIEVFKSKVIMYLYEDAAKQYKHKLFSGCEDTTKYSAVCDSFDEIGIQIFGEDFVEVYYNSQKG